MSGDYGMNPSMLLSPEQAAKFLGVSVSFLLKDRKGARRFPYIMISPKCIRYRMADLVEFLNKRTIEPREQATA
jgi:hypothetical protein